MKKVTKSLGILTLSAFLAISNPVAAQSADTGTTTTQTADDNDDDSGKIGLAGLLGLLGLLGLRKKDRDDARKYSSTTTGGTTR